MHMVSFSGIWQPIGSVLWHWSMGWPDILSKNETKLDLLVRWLRHNDAFDYKFTKLHISFAYFDNSKFINSSAGLIGQVAFLRWGALTHD